MCLYKKKSIKMYVLAFNVQSVGNALYPFHSNSVTIIAICSQPHETIILLLFKDAHYGAATGCWISIKVTYQPFIFHVEIFV